MVFDLAAFRAEMASEQDGLLSFDLFDTLVTRRLYQPKDVFLLMEQHMVDIGLTRPGGLDWHATRIAAEAEVRQRSQKDEITLAEIYSEIASRYPLDPDALARLIKLEIDLETSLVCPIAETLSEFNAFSGKGRVVTDTYFDRESILGIVGNCGIKLEQGSLFVSSECGRSKHKGSLYPWAGEMAAPLPSKVLHVGDNEHSDVAMARKAGLRTLHYRRSEPTRYERLIRESAPTSDVKASALSGATRVARLSSVCRSSHEQAIWDVGANIAGPLLFCYVAWILCEAERRGLQRLYFLARDGQILERVAREIADTMGSNIQFSYLAASRQAWHAPAFVEFDEATTGWVLDGGADLTLEVMLRRLGLTAAECEEALVRSGIETKDVARTVSALGGRIDLLLKDPAFVAQVRARAEAGRELMLEYLVAQGLVGSRSVGIVDIGWNGRLQASLSKVLASVDAAARPEVTGFYLGLHSRPASLPPERLLSFASAATLPAGLQLNGSLLEIFCAADHGTVVGYRRTAHGVEPRYRSEANPEAQEWGLAIQQAAIVSCARNILAGMKLVGMTLPELVAGLQGPAFECLRMFTEAPSREEGEAYGRFLHSIGQGHDDFAELAPRWTAAQLLPRPLRRTQRPPTLWKEATLVRSLPFAINKAMRRLLRYKRAI